MENREFTQSAIVRSTRREGPRSIGGFIVVRATEIPCVENLERHSSEANSSPLHRRSLCTEVTRKDKRPASSFPLAPLVITLSFERDTREFDYM